MSATPSDEQAPAWFLAFEKRMTEQVAAALYDHEERLVRQLTELWEKQREDREHVQELKRIAYANASALTKIFHMLEQGASDATLRAELIDLHKQAAHRLEYGEPERNGSGNP